MELRTRNTEDLYNFNQKSTWNWNKQRVICACNGKYLVRAWKFIGYSSNINRNICVIQCLHWNWNEKNKKFSADMVFSDWFTRFYAVERKERRGEERRRKKPSEMNGLYSSTIPIYFYRLVFCSVSAVESIRFDSQPSGFRSDGIFDQSVETLKSITHFSVDIVDVPKEAWASDSIMSIQYW